MRKTWHITALSSKLELHWAQAFLGRPLYIISNIELLFSLSFKYLFIYNFIKRMQEERKKNVLHFDVDPDTLP